MIDCKHYEKSKYEYTDFFNISDVRGSQPEGYLIRFPFKAYAGRDVHVVLSATNNPDFEKDAVYEILIGGWGNSRVLIRRKKRTDPMADFEYDQLLKKYEENDFTIEISTGTMRMA